MKGDFSQWRPFDPNENFNGVLHQQGRVLIDPDWNEHTELVQHWQGQAGRDVIGDGIAAVAADDPDGFKIEAAKVITTGTTRRVELQVHAGHAWADGLLVHLGGNAPITRVATYFEPPIQNPAADPSTIGDKVRDAVILEVSREALNGFQWPDRLIEPALGGPDTTERIQTRLAFRLLRLGVGENCHTIAPKLKDDPNTFGRLSVSLEPPVVVAGDCPVVQGGGYTGFEHQLYRIEVGPLGPGGRQFKWSRFNGGLVGRGNFVPGQLATSSSPAIPDRVEVTANFTAIMTSGLSSFYLEAVQFDPTLGQWRVTYGATATLDPNNNNLVLSASTLGASLPIPLPPPSPPAPPPTDIFFRLWDGLLAIGGFTNTATPALLRDGIHLAFDTPATKTYREGDYWVFPVRAGEIKNPQTLINAQPPQGVRYHRVPLAELNWQPGFSITAPIQIEDCRRPFRPLTKLDTCCTYRVGDGIQSFGDFNATDYPDATPIGAIQAAINALPKSGGQVCVLPGEFRENVLMTNLHDVTITGCGPRSLIVGRDPAAPVLIYNNTNPAGPEFQTGVPIGTAPSNNNASPVIHVIGGQSITIDSLAITAHETGIGLLLEGPPTFNVTLTQLLVRAATQSAIRAQFLQQLTIRECQVQMLDMVCRDPAIFALGDDMLIERNVVETVTGIVDPDGTGPAIGGFYLFSPQSNSRGGIQIGGGSDRVRLTENLIQGGTGTGINLGSLIFINKGNSNPIPLAQWPKQPPVDPCDPATPATAVLRVAWVPWQGSEVRAASAGTLTEILIERNRIYDMGMNGIGVVGFFDLEGADEFITVEKLSIIGNDIRRCLNRTIAPISLRMLNSSGYGGISLADVEQLVIRDNLIADNGLSDLEPVCGIFVLHAEGMEISRNRILNNGPKSGEPASQAKIGARGGIHISYAVTPVVVFTLGGQTVGPIGNPSSRFTSPGRTVPGQNGEPALKVEGNVVSVPLGQALSVTALGPISVVANEFTSRGVVAEVASASTVAANPIAAIAAATVAILDLGASMENSGQLLLFSSVANGSVSADGLNAPQTRSGLDDLRLGACMANGKVLFANNQCVLDVLETGVTFSRYSIGIFSLDDIAFHGNQCDCVLFDDRVFAQVVLFGFSVRMVDNRLTETLRRAVYSATTFGFLNMTTHNQTTHCLLRQAFTPALLIGDRNTVLIDPAGTAYCKPFWWYNFGQATTQTAQNT